MTTATAATAARRAVEDVFAGRALLAFYVAVLAVALVGSTQGVEHWIGWAPPAAFGATLLAELGGVALSIFSDRRRQKGERALVARVFSAAFAAGAIAVQLRGHADAGHITAVGIFFAGFSAAGYVIYLLDSAAKTRDAKRADGKLADTPPDYGAYQWCRHPLLTARARRLAVANAEVRLVERLTSREQGGPDRPTTALLGRAASLAAAAAQVAEERRLAAIRKALRKRIAAGVDPTMATIAVNTFDLGRVAEGLAKGADYPALTELLAVELTPARIAAGVTARRTRRTWFSRGDAPQTQEIVAALTPAPAAETAPETVETAPETGETDQAPTTPAHVELVPAGVRLLPVRCAVSLRMPPAPEPIVVRPVPAPMPRRTPETDQTGPETVETDPASTSTPPPAVDHVAKESAPALPPIAPALVPHLAKVMAAHRDWPLTIAMPGKHPDALTVTKILAAIGMTGKQTGCDIRGTLLALSARPDAAEKFVGVRELTAAAA